MPFKKINKKYLDKLKYYRYYKRLPIVPKTILLEASHGRSVQGNIFYLLRELITNSLYYDHKIYIAVRNLKLCADLQWIVGDAIERAEFVLMGSREYYRALASSKYLVNDTSFGSYFIKKEGQIYLNVWHGTPLKTLGRRVATEANKIGNIQKNFIAADYLLYPSEYMRNHMIEDYMIANISRAKILLSGYPRNAAFFDDEKKREIIDRYSLGGKRVYVYMPTWRGTTNKVDNKNKLLNKYLAEIDEKLNDDEIMYIKLHTFVRKAIKTAKFKHIFDMPKDYECYEFLNAADCLITDYSSVMYDFAVTRKKITLFTYDEEKYLKKRGLYEPLESLPFDNVKNVDNLLMLLRSEKSYDDTAFLEKYCAYESAEAAEKLCRYLFLGDHEAIETEDMPSNGKENVLIYAGSLAPNGITTSLMNLLKEIGADDYNYFITAGDITVERNKKRLLDLPDGVGYIMYQGKMNVSFVQKMAIFLYEKGRIPFRLYWSIAASAYKCEIKRRYADAVFNSVIQFNGYGYKQILFFSSFACNRIIYAHSDMLGEIETKGEPSRHILEYAYSVYDKVAVVTEDLIDSTKTLTKVHDKIKVSRNIIDHETIKMKAQLPISFDKRTKCNVAFDEVRRILESDSKVILNVGRYSLEKGHRRLIDAFEQLYAENNGAYLFILGGYQLNGLYNELTEYVTTLNCKNNVVLLYNMSNPFPLIKACDYFVLPSYYEGFGLVLAEADILGLPMISADITGPRNFMMKYGGTLVENSREGLLSGMKRLLNGEIFAMNVDYSEYNKVAINEYKELLRQ